MNYKFFSETLGRQKLSRKFSTAAATCGSQDAAVRPVVSVRQVRQKTEAQVGSRNTLQDGPDGPDGPNGHAAMAAKPTATARMP